MADQSLTELDEQLCCAFVLSSALYFRLVGVDPDRRDPQLGRWHGLLHDTAGDLAGLSETTETFGATRGHLLSGVNDLRHSLQDLADTAVRLGQIELSGDMLRSLQRLEAQIELDRQHSR